MPISLTFGPWAPDIANNPMQFPDTQGPVPIPCADCLNVIFSNGSYRSIPSPAPTVIAGNISSALSVPAIAAYSYYDNVAQQQTVFAGTQTGLQQLVAGNWSIVPFLTFSGATLIGQSMAFSIGNLGNTDALRGIRLTTHTGTIVRSIQGVTIVAGQNFTKAGDAQTGFGNPGGVSAFGTCANRGVLTGQLVALYDVIYGAGGFGTVFQISTTVDPTQSSFVSIKAAGKVLTSASATYTYVAASQRATWTWTSQQFGLASGSTYPVTFA